MKAQWLVSPVLACLSHLMACMWKAYCTSLNWVTITLTYDKARHEMVGERTGVRFRLGDRLTIKVARVDLETTKIDFTLVSHASHLPVHKTAALQASIHEPSGDAQKKTLSTEIRINVNADFKPLSTRALEKAKHDRTGKHKNATKAPTKSATKQRTKNTKNKGKPKR
jgi:ribonuclease R